MKITMWFTKVCVMSRIVVCVCDSISIGNLDRFAVDDKMRVCATKVMAQAQINHPLTVAMIAVDDAVAVHFYGLKNYTFVSRDENWYGDTLPTDVYVVSSKDVNDLKNKIHVLRNDSYWNPLNKLILIVEHGFFKNEVTTFLRKYNIVNVTIIAKSPEGRHELQGFGPELDSCNKPLQIQFIGYCSDVEINNIFPVRKPGKLDKCLVKFITHTFLPYTGTFDTGLKGVENNVMDMIHKALGITFELVHHERNEDFGKWISNGTFSGMLHSVCEYDAEGAVGGVYINYERFATFAFTYPYVINHLKVVIARADLLGTWDAVLQQVHATTIFLIVSFFVIFFIAVTSLMVFPIFPNKRRDIGRNFLIVWGYFLNNIKVKNISSRLSPRIIVIDMLVFNILMYCVIQASLSSATTKPIRGPQATEVNEVIETYYPVTQQYFKAFNSPDEKICRTLNECTIKVKDSKGTTRPLYAVIPEINYNYFKWHLLDHKGYFQIHSLRDSVGIMWQSICFVKGSTVLPAIQNVLENMVSSHLIAQYLEVIEHFETLQHFYTFPRETLKKHDIYELKKTFIILAGGLCISFIVFIIEVVSYKLK